MAVPGPLACLRCGAKFAATGRLWCCPAMPCVRRAGMGQARGVSDQLARPVETRRPAFHPLPRPHRPAPPGLHHYTHTHTPPNRCPAFHPRSRPPCPTGGARQHRGCSSGHECAGHHHLLPHVRPGPQLAGCADMAWHGMQGADMPWHAGHAGPVGVAMRLCFACVRTHGMGAGCSSPPACPVCPGAAAGPPSRPGGLCSPLWGKRPQGCCQPRRHAAPL